MLRAPLVIFTVHDLNVRGQVRAPRYAVAPAPIPARRWLVACAIAGSAIHHHVAGGPTLATVIDLALGAFALGQLTRDPVRLTDRIAWTVVVACLISIFEPAAAAPIALAVAIARLVAVGVAYREIAVAKLPARKRAATAAERERELGFAHERRWAGRAMALWLGWSAVVVVGALAPLVGGGVAAILAGAIGVAAITVALVRRDAVLVGSLGGGFAIACGHHPEPAVALAALLASAACAASAVLIAGTWLAPRTPAAPAMPRPVRRAPPPPTGTFSRRAVPMLDWTALLAAVRRMPAGLGRVDAWWPRRAPRRPVRRRPMTSDPIALADRLRALESTRPSEATATKLAA